MDQASSPQTVTDISAAITLIAVLVVTGTQLTKRLLPGDQWGPYLGLLWSVLGVWAWLYSQPVYPPARETTFAVVSATVVVWGYASGLYSVAKLEDDPQGLIGRMVRRGRPERAARAIREDDGG